MSFKATIKDAYVALRCLYLETAAWKTGLLEVGRVTVLLSNDETFVAEGKLNARGGLTGMAKLYKRLGLVTGAELEYEIPSKNTIVIQTPDKGDRAQPEAAKAADAAIAQTVFERKALKHIHIEPFRAENLHHWEPETETDVYLAFGVLQEFTDFQYCCGASKALLCRLGAFDESGTKPDAILVDRATDQYLMAEWKMRSSAFATNHKPEDVDVLVCWIDDETARNNLPLRVVALQDVARLAAADRLQEEIG
ncbi:hypothetical protein [Sorangium sp. So ce124]|uniref:hypothetical protein n=1 Tax=Sorangium sp. So ce124 TaxID=3133280 RepID=UPI003F637532